MKLELEAEEGLPVVVSRDALTRIVVNLLDNAVKYGPGGQTVRVEIGRSNGNVGRRAVIPAAHDMGSLDAEMREQLA